MAAVTVAVESFHTKNGIGYRYSGTGASNTDATLTTTAVAKHKSYRVSYGNAVYSGAATQAGVTFRIDSALGSSFDTTLSTGSANVVNTAYTPSGDVVLLPGDAFVITALAGGSVTAAITVVLEPLI